MLAGLGRATRREIGQPRERLGGQAFERLLITQTRSRIRVAQRLPNLPSVYHVLGNRSDRAPDAERKRSARRALRAVKRALAAIDVDQMNVSRLKKCACRRAGVLSSSGTRRQWMRRPCAFLIFGSRRSRGQKADDHSSCNCP